MAMLTLYLVRLGAAAGEKRAWGFSVNGKLTRISARIRFRTCPLLYVRRYD